MAPFKGPQLRLVRCFWKYRKIRRLSGVACWAGRSQDNIKNNWLKPWQRLLKIHLFSDIKKLEGCGPPRPTPCVRRITKWRRKSLHAVVYPVNCDKNKYTFFKYGALKHCTLPFSGKLVLPKFQHRRTVYSACDSNHYSSIVPVLLPRFLQNYNICSWISTFCSRRIIQRTIIFCQKAI